MRVISITVLALALVTTIITLISHRQTTLSVEAGSMKKMGLLSQILMQATMMKMMAPKLGLTLAINLHLNSSLPKLIHHHSAPAPLPKYMPRPAPMTKYEPQQVYYKPSELPYASYPSNPSYETYPSDPIYASHSLNAPQSSELSSPSYASYPTTYVNFDTTLYDDKPHY